VWQGPDVGLGPEGARCVEELEAGYDAFLDDWRALTACSDFRLSEQVVAAKA